MHLPRSKVVFTCILFLFVSFSFNTRAKSVEQLDINDMQKVTLIFDSNIRESDKPKLRSWMTHVSHALSLVYGEMPVDHFVTKIKATTTNYGTVPGGEVTHDMPPQVRLVVNTKRSLEELKADWTLYHELSHLLIPYDTGDSRWLAEGLASYYQNIIQARAGMFDEKTMWLKLYQGFERAKRQNNYRQQTLNFVSRNIDSNHQFMRIYWSGALFWLQTDIELRRLNRGLSLDSALKAMRNCCFNRYLNTKQTIGILDEITQTTVFTRLYGKFSNSFAIPEYLGLFNLLGITIKQSNLTLQATKPFSDIRHAVYKGTSNSND